VILSPRHWRVTRRGQSRTHGGAGSGYPALASLDAGGTSLSSAFASLMGAQGGGVAATAASTGSGVSTVSMLQHLARGIGAWHLGSSALAAWEAEEARRHDSDAGMVDEDDDGDDGASVGESEGESDARDEEEDEDEVEGEEDVVDVGDGTNDGVGARRRGGRMAEVPRGSALTVSSGRSAAAQVSGSINTRRKATTASAHRSPAVPSGKHRSRTAALAGEHGMKETSLMDDSITRALEEDMLDADMRTALQASRKSARAPNHTGGGGDGGGGGDEDNMFVWTARTRHGTAYKQVHLDFDLSLPTAGGRGRWGSGSVSAAVTRRLGSRSHVHALADAVAAATPLDARGWTADRGTSDDLASGVDATLPLIDLPAASNLPTAAAGLVVCVENAGDMPQAVLCDLVDALAAVQHLLWERASIRQHGSPPALTGVVPAVTLVLQFACTRRAVAAALPGSVHATEVHLTRMQDVLVGVHDKLWVHGALPLVPDRALAVRLREYIFAEGTSLSAYLEVVRRVVTDHFTRPHPDCWSLDVVSAGGRGAGLRVPHPAGAFAVRGLVFPLEVAIHALSSASSGDAGAGVSGANPAPAGGAVQPWQLPSDRMYRAATAAAQRAHPRFLAILSQLASVTPWSPMHKAAESTGVWRLFSDLHSDADIAAWRDATGPSLTAAVEGADHATVLPGEVTAQWPFAPHPVKSGGGGAGRLPRLPAPPLQPPVQDARQVLAAALYLWTCKRLAWRTAAAIVWHFQHGKDPTAAQLYKFRVHCCGPWGASGLLSAWKQTFFNDVPTREAVARARTALARVVACDGAADVCNGVNLRVLARRHIIMLRSRISQLDALVAQEARDAAAGVSAATQAPATPLTPSSAPAPPSPPAKPLSLPAGGVHSAGLTAAARRQALHATLRSQVEVRAAEEAAAAAATAAAACVPRSDAMRQQIRALWAIVMVMFGGDLCCFHDMPLAEAFTVGNGGGDVEDIAYDPPLARPFPPHSDAAAAVRALAFCGHRRAISVRNEWYRAFRDQLPGFKRAMEQAAAADAAARDRTAPSASASGSVGHKRGRGGTAPTESEVTAVLATEQMAYSRLIAAIDELRVRGIVTTIPHRPGHVDVHADALALAQPGGLW